MTGVQIIGWKGAVACFDKCGGDAWALYQGKTFIVGGVGSDQLEGWLQDFEAHGSTATYTLRVYDTNQVPTSVTGTTDYIASVGFKLIDGYEGYGIAGHSNKLMERIKGIEERLNGEGANDENLNDIIMGWLQNPEKLGMVAGAIRTLFSGTLQAAAVSVAPVQTIAGFDNTGSSQSNQEDSLTRLSKAIDILEKCDPQLVPHLEKLAKLAQHDPLLFKAVTSKLDAL